MSRFSRIDLDALAQAEGVDLRAALARLKSIYADVDERNGRNTRDLAMPCGRGCDGCCHESVFLTPLEFYGAWDLLQQAYDDETLDYVEVMHTRMSQAMLAAHHESAYRFIAEARHYGQMMLEVQLRDIGKEIADHWIAHGTAVEADHQRVDVLARCDVVLHLPEETRCGPRTLLPGARAGLPSACPARSRCCSTSPSAAICAA